ncbi:MAG: phosphoadenosine phosphosulfate reductase family protein, partial [Pseudothermotoga sp.]|nr:phosphoadenosine phosphosulfate reductase family protein [Pseudothermotoga sp.]
MKCKKCSQTAVIHLPQHNVAYCEEHFNDYFLNRVQKAIRKYSMIEENERVLVAVSGGKDSVSLWHALVKLNYNCDALFLDTGLGTPKLEEL